MVTAAAQSSLIQMNPRKMYNEYTVNGYFLMLLVVCLLEVFELIPLNN